MGLSDEHSSTRAASNADVLYRTAISELVAEDSFSRCWRELHRWHAFENANAKKRSNNAHYQRRQNMTRVSSRWL